MLAHAAGTKQTATLALISAAGLLVSLTQSILIPVLPTLTVDPHTSGTNAEWLLTSPPLVAAAAVPVAGRLADPWQRATAAPRATSTPG